MGQAREAAALGVAAAPTRSFGCILLLALALGLAPSPATGQRDASAGRIPTVTRLVKLFSELEGTLNDRVASKDAAAIMQMLDPGFEARAGDRPGTPMPRDEWIGATIADSVHAVRTEQMAVHDFGTVAVVSFREMNSDDRSGTRRERFVVDCWTRAGDRWLLAVRYLGTSASVAPAPAKRKQPTGRQ